MNSISFACPFCSGVFQIDTQQEASQVYCPHCNEIIDIPKQDSSSDKSAPSSNASTSEPEKKSKRPRKRSKKKPAAPVTANNTDLFPPGYVPDSAAAETPDKSSTSSSTKPQATEPVRETPSKTAAASQLPQPAADRPTTAELGSDAVESLLPPGVNAGSTNPPASASTSSDNIPPTSKSATVDHLLPASVAASEPSSSVANPFASIDIPGTDGTTLDADGDTPQIALLEPVKTVAIRGQEFELKQRTPEEKSQWRRRKNMLMWISGILILLGTLFAMKR